MCSCGYLLFVSYTHSPGGVGCSRRLRGSVEGGAAPVAALEQGQGGRDVRDAVGARDRGGATRDLYTPLLVKEGVRCRSRGVWKE